MSEHGNKHIKVTVKYAGKSPDYQHTYAPEELVSKVREDAMKKFGITAKGSDYCLQFGPTVLIDSMILQDSGLKPGNEGNILDLVAVDDTDTDGGC